MNVPVRITDTSNLIPTRAWISTPAPTIWAMR